jgi:NADPH:quinone reductase-like Zn-dependent oxidoreductase
MESHGGPEVLQYGERPEPSPRAGEVKVRVRAAALNRLDTYVRTGRRGQRRNFPSFHILGGDSAGVIAEAGSDAHSHMVGRRVVINPRIPCGACDFCIDGSDDLCPRFRFLGSNCEGSYAEFVCVPASNVHPIADDVTFETAAATPTVYLPTWNILIRKAQLKPWETALVLSASGGVGTAAIQVAKSVVGATVITTTSSPEKAAMARELGADHVIDYTKESIPDRVKELTHGRGVDVVVDHVGAKFFEDAYNSLKRGGRYGLCGVTSGYLAQLQLGSLFTKQLQVFGVFMGSRADMSQVTQMLNQGRIQPVIHRTFPLEQASAAHEVMEERSFFGKLVLQV